MLIVKDKYTHEWNFSQTLQTNNEQFQIAVTLLSAYKGIFDVTNNKKINFLTVLASAEISVITSPKGAYELTSLKKKLKRYITVVGFITEEEYPFSIKASSSTLGSKFKNTPPRGWQISFVQNDTWRDLSGSEPNALHEEHDLSDNPVHILSLENIFLENDIATEMIFPTKRTGVNQSYSIEVHPG